MHLMIKFKLSHFIVESKLVSNFILLIYSFFMLKPKLVEAIYLQFGSLLEEPCNHVWVPLFVLLKLVIHI